MNFKDFKTEILSRAKTSNACNCEYSRAESSKNFAELIKVLTDNFAYACNNKIIDAELLEKIGSEICNKNNLFFNCDTNTGYLLAYGSATVRAYGSATVRAYGSATVEAYGSATVRAYGSATVRAYGSATVEASDSATVEASGSATVEAYGSATVRAYGSATVRAYGSATVEASGSATVRAYGSAYICSYNSIEHKVNDKAILRYYYENKIILADINSLKS